jgi:hypothetical protein
MVLDPVTLSQQHLPLALHESPVQRPPSLYAQHAVKRDLEHTPGDVPGNVLGHDWPAGMVLCSIKCDGALCDEICIILVVATDCVLNILWKFRVTAKHPDIGAQDVSKPCGGLTNFLYYRLRNFRRVFFFQKQYSQHHQQPFYACHLNILETRMASLFMALKRWLTISCQSSQTPKSESKILISCSTITTIHHLKQIQTLRGQYQNSLHNNE